MHGNNDNEVYCSRTVFMGTDNFSGSIFTEIRVFSGTVKMGICTLCIGDVFIMDSCILQTFKAYLTNNAILSSEWM